MEKKELVIPLIYDQEKIVGRGGNQDWFQEKWHRQAGCASTSGANLAAYYAASSPLLRGLYPGSAEKFSLPEFLQAMNNMYGYMRPGFLGYPFAGKFAHKFVRYARDRGVMAAAEVYNRPRSWQDSLRFVQRHIDSGSPVALLILWHRSPALQSINWHWMTIFGYTQCEAGGEGARVILSNCGHREEYNARDLFEVHQKNIIRMVAFRMMPV